jgi:hypothetical protein
MSTELILVHGWDYWQKGRISRDKNCFAGQPGRGFDFLANLSAPDSGSPDHSVARLVRQDPNGDAGTAVPQWQGEECDYFVAVEALMAMEPVQVQVQS